MKKKITYTDESMNTGRVIEDFLPTIFSTRDFRAAPVKYGTLIPECDKGYVSLNQFVI